VARGSRDTEPAHASQAEVALPSPVASARRVGDRIKKRDRNWMVIAPDGALVCITLYKKGAQEVVRRLTA